MGEWFRTSLGESSDDDAESSEEAPTLIPRHRVRGASDDESESEVYPEDLPPLLPRTAMDYSDSESDDDDDTAPVSECNSGDDDDSLFCVRTFNDESSESKSEDDFLVPLGSRTIEDSLVEESVTGAATTPL